LPIHLPIFTTIPVSESKQAFAFANNNNGWEQRKEKIPMVLLRHSTITIDQATDAVSVFHGLFSHEDKIDQDKEHFYVMHLDSRRHISLVELVAIGVLTDVRIHPRETFRRAVIEGTASIIVAHNHPSGDTTPSENDIKVTTYLFKAGEVLQIPLLDHLIFTKISYYSFLKNKKQSSVLTQV
jgi:DNA repair protein RadC